MNQKQKTTKKEVIKKIREDAENLREELARCEMAQILGLDPLSNALHQ